MAHTRTRHARLRTGVNLALLLLSIDFFLPAAAAAADRIRTEPLTGVEFVWVEGGCFEMGCGRWAGKCYRGERPVHEVCLDGFWMGRYEVTQGQWRKVTGSNPSKFTSCGEDCPVEWVSWNDAQDFIREISSRSGRSFRLPTEAEWEYAARSGGRKEKYAGSDEVDAVAWHRNNSGGKTHPVGRKRPNGLGLYDMSGNVWEWCRDLYGEDYYRRSPRDNPTGLSEGLARVIRGGSWGNIARDVRAAERFMSGPANRADRLGFRLVLPAGSKGEEGGSLGF